MQYLPLLGKKLKSDELIDLLETYDVAVTYDYDRLHENSPDTYWATIQELGIQLRFDEHQVLTTLFVSLTAEDELEPADLGQSDIQVFETKATVRNFATQNAIPFMEGEAEFLGTKHDWIKLKHENHSVHYDFGDGPLKKVTLELMT